MDTMMRRLVLFLLVCVTAVSHAAMPRYIPEPDWDWDATVAEVYGSDGYYTHWIDNTHPSATDADNPNGSPTTPRETLPDMSALAAGSVVQVRGGPYVLSGLLVINGSAGTAEAPIFIRGESDSAQVELQNQPTGDQRITITGRYVNFMFFHMTGRDNPLTIANTDHVTVRHNTITGTGTTVQGNGAVISAAGATNIVRAYNTITQCGDWDATTENDMHALSIGSNQTYCWDVYNTVSYIGGDAVGNGHGANHTSHHLYIGGNHFHHCRENPIDLKEVHNIIISENVMHDVVPAPGSPSSAPGEAVVLHYGPDSGQGPWAVWVLNNLIYSARMGIISTSLWSQSGAAAASNPLTYEGSPTLGTAWIIGNIVYSGESGLTARGGGIIKLYNNTVDAMTEEAFGSSSTSSSMFLDFRNNMATDAGSHFSMEGSSSTVRGQTTATHFLLWQPTGSVSITWSSTYSSVAAWIAATVAGDSSIESDPLFVNTAGHNYALQASSQARDAGYDWRSAATSAYNADFGTSLTDSMWADRNSVAFDSAPDLGALQYDSPATPPTAPTGATLAAIGSRGIVLAWTDAASNEERYDIEWSVDGGSTWTGSATVGADATSKRVQTLAPSTTYHARLRATNGVASSDWVIPTPSSITTEGPAQAGYLQPGPAVILP
jgi:hypothetical protein